VATFGATDVATDAYLAHSAAIFCDRLSVGSGSFVAAHAYLTGEVAIGANSTINPFTVVRGQVTIGDGARIGAHASILGFNHGTSPDEPIFHQPLTSIGITIGDDVWIGSNVVILDGVRIGDHAIVGAGAVVTKDVDEWAVVVGNPARKVRDRRHSSARTVVGTGDLEERLSTFAARTREQAGEVLARCYDGSQFVDRPGAGAVPALRPWCDAIEIADLLLGTAPPGHDPADLATMLRSRQDPLTGLVGGPSPFAEPASYHILCLGYALRLLNSRFEYPVAAIRDFSAEELEAGLSRLDWAGDAWGAGAIVDGLATAMAFDHLDFAESGPLSTLVGWLVRRADPATGMWGTGPSRLEVVNGFYRLTRGSFAQFGLPLPYPQAAIRTVLDHAADASVFAGAGWNACNVLDVIHPLWLAGRQTDAYRPEGQRWARAQLDRALGRWVDGAGFAFAPGVGEPGLQGTEMWLAITWLLADYLGVASALGYRPRGVHRPEPLVPAAKLP
jgi:acetyltransferase-like isoleucine patch superfamily enzyme